MIVEGKEYRRINSRRLTPGEALKIPGRWDAMREMVASETKSKRRFLAAIGVFGFFVGMAGAFVLDHIILANESGVATPARQESAAAPVGQDSIEPATTDDQAQPHGEDGRVVGDARRGVPARERAISRLHVAGDGVNPRAGPATAKSAIEAISKNNTVRASETPRSSEAALGLASDGRCRRASGGNRYSTNCFQRGDNNGAPDKTLDIFQELIKLKKYNCDERIEAASYVDGQKNRIYLVQCGRLARYRVEIIGANLKVEPAKVD